MALTLGDVAFHTVGILGVLVILRRLWVWAMGRRRRRAEQAELARRDAFLAHQRALRSLAADARRRPDFPKLPRI